MSMKQELLPEGHSDATLSAHLLVLRSRDVLGSDEGGEHILLSIEQGKCFRLGQLGSRIWELIQEPETVGQVVNSLMDECKLDRLTCETHVFALLARLSEERLIKFSLM